MPLEVSYHASAPNPNMHGSPISSESLALTATSALTGATPDNAMTIRITATENARFEYSSATSAATATSHYLANGRSIDLPAKSGFKIGARTA